MLKELVIVASVILVLFATGCVSAPVKETANSTTLTTETQPKDRYVKLLMFDGSEVGGKYVSESVAFVTIIPIYILDKEGFVTKGNGNEVGVKTSLVNSMMTIEDPRPWTNATLKAQSDKATEIAAAKKLEQDKITEAHRIEMERRDAEIAKRMPTKRSTN